ncbi:MULTISPECIES: transposase [Actinomadura]|uniref:Transposase DDE domain-containing protein n=1 Tax=Actinomadura yumaensis TaxID=111807 RepID=A0ABW2CD10_9ACTN
MLDSQTVRAAETVGKAGRGYDGALVTWTGSFLNLSLAIASRPAGIPGFVVVPRRWVVERTLSWLVRARRNVRDYARLPQHSEAHPTWAATTLMTRRLTRALRAGAP